MYYVGLLAGTNDMALLARSQVGRDINRHYYTGSEISAAQSRAVVRDLMELIRSAHRRHFREIFQLEQSTDQVLALVWRNGGTLADELRVDLRTAGM